MIDRTTASPGPVRFHDGRKQPIQLKKRSWPRRLFRLAVLLAFVGGAAVGVLLGQVDRTPREWAAALQRPGISGHSTLGNVADITARWLLRADRLAVAEPVALPASLGAA
ncbi:MAG: hypothetical protein ACJ8AW_00120, partial [Rhodopila sp.]